MIVRRIRTVLVIAACLLPLAMPAIAFAQKPGDKIEYKVEDFPEKWLPGVFVRNAGNDSQVIIREMPTPFEPGGFQRAWDKDKIRLVPAPAPVAAVPNQPGLPAPLPMPGELPAPLPMPGELPAPLPMPGDAPAPLPMPGAAGIPAAVPFDPSALKEGDPIDTGLRPGRRKYGKSGPSCEKPATTHR